MACVAMTPYLLIRGESDEVSFICPNRYLGVMLVQGCSNSVDRKEP